MAFSPYIVEIRLLNFPPKHFTHQNKTQITTPPSMCQICSHRNVKEKLGYVVLLSKMLSSYASRLFFKNCARLLSTNTPAVITSDNNPATAPRVLQFPSKYVKPRQVWLETLETIDEKKLTILELHPDIFAQAPRIDLIHQNVRWQANYRYVSNANSKIKFEVRGGGKKPWPQKGSK